VKLVVEDQKQNQNIPEKVFLLVPENATAYEILKQAADSDASYKFEELTTTYGRMITEISGVQQNHETGYYWSLYESDNVLAQNGVDLFIPKNDACIIFKYERCAVESSVVDEPSGGGSLV
jgi:hypothetical protein